MLAAGLIVSRFVHYVAVLALFGASLFPLYAYAGHPDDAARRQLVQWLRPVLATAAALALVSGLGWFAFTSAGMSGALSGAWDPQVLMTVLQATDFGPLWLGRLTLAALVLLMVLLSRSSERPDWVAPVLAGLLLASLAGTGHARASEGWSAAVHVLADAAHLLAAGVWLGGLWPLAAALAWAHRGDVQHMRGSGELLIRFSGIGYLAVAVLVASGVLNSWYLVGSIEALTSGAYGRLLLFKVALFVVMAALAAANRFWITPRLHRPGDAPVEPWLRRIRRHVAAELALGLTVVGVVSLLGTLDPGAPA